MRRRGTIIKMIRRYVKDAFERLADDYETHTDDPNVYDPYTGTDSRTFKTESNKKSK